MKFTEEEIKRARMIIASVNGQKGGFASAEAQSKEELSKRGSAGAAARWGNKKRRTGKSNQSRPTSRSI